MIGLFGSLYATTCQQLRHHGIAAEMLRKRLSITFLLMSQGLIIPFYRHFFILLSYMVLYRIFVQNYYFFPFIPIFGPSTFEKNSK